MFGATDGVLAGPRTRARRFARLTGGRGVDFAFVTVGRARGDRRGGGAISRPAARWWWWGCRRSGTVVGYDPTTLAAMNQAIIGSRMGRTVLARDIPWLIEHWRAGRLKLAELVSRALSARGDQRGDRGDARGAARRNVIVFGS